MVFQALCHTGVLIGRGSFNFEINYEYGSFYHDLGFANDQNLGALAQKFVRCSMKNLPGVPKKNI